MGAAHAREQRKDCLFAYSPTHLRTCSLACLPTYVLNLLTYLLAYLLSYLLTHLLSMVVTCARPAGRYLAPSAIGNRLVCKATGHVPPKFGYAWARVTW